MFFKGIKFTIICLLINMLTISFSTAQNPAQEAERIRSDRNYYCGDGIAEDYEQAQKQALANIINSISTVVSSKFTMESTEKTANGVVTSKRTVNDIVNIYSNATELRNVETIIIPNNSEQTHVFCYISRAEVQKIFERRKEKILSYVVAAQKAEKKLKLNEALQYYYWGLLLLNSYPDRYSVEFANSETEKSEKLLTWLNSKIPDILSNIEITAGDISDMENYHQVDLFLTYHGQPIAACDYDYFNGRNFSHSVGAKDGRGIAEFSNILTSFEVRIEYTYENEASNLDPELSDVIAGSDRIKFKQNTHVVQLNHSAINTATKDSAPTNDDKIDRTIVPDATKLPDKEQQTNLHGTDVQLSAPPQPLADSCLQVMKEVERAIKSRNFASVQSLFTPEGYEMFQELIEYGNGTILKTPEYSFLSTGDNILCRSIPMSFKFKSNSKTVIEDVTFRFNFDKKIESLAFTLSKIAENDILAKENWNEQSRISLMQFLENYQTAYALKRLDYLESIFSDDALIIVGTKLKTAPPTEHIIQLKDKERYSLITKTKAEYFTDLKRAFDSKEYINLQLTDNEIMQAGNGQEVYGVQIQQLYYSNNYADCGYLFLLVDLRDDQKPVIHVRAWQPEKNPNFKLINLSNFNF